MLVARLSWSQLTLGSYQFQEHLKTYFNNCHILRNNSNMKEFKRINTYFELELSRFLSLELSILYWEVYIVESNDGSDSKSFYQSSYTGDF